MASIEKDLFAFQYPEFKISDCVIGWTKVPCGTLDKPKLCHQEIKGKCKKSKKSKFRVYVLVKYPENVEKAVKSEIDRCHKIAVKVATVVIAKAAAAASEGGPAATIAAAIGAIGHASEAYGKSFYACLAATSIPTVIQRQIKFTFKHEKKGITDWAYHDIYSQYGNQLVHDWYGNQLVHDWYGNQLVHGWYGNEYIYPYYS